LEINKTVIVASSWSSIFTLRYFRFLGPYVKPSNWLAASYILLFDVRHDRSCTLNGGHCSSLPSGLKSSMISLSIEIYSASIFACPLFYGQILLITGIDLT
jgi:hypothetical protein